ncbi:MarR family winged helix-turn-helix transcriptional regulator [Actinoplanes sp. NPDC051343]|uniref:MarR family winged helix-turn-helix transcriptional regulator n=1 Tax=Actinoplanes sp. NPDC051343 TaxID=3363906 RepID=UPI003791A936
MLDLTALLNAAGHALSNRLAAALAEVGLTPRMQSVLVHAIEEDRTQIELATLADLDKTTMVSTVDELERLGLAERKPSPTDRRARLIVVTAEGRRAAAEGRRTADRIHASALAEVSDPDAFATALATLAEAARGPGPQPIRRSRGR